MEPLVGAVAIWLDGLPRWASSALIAAVVGGLAGGLFSLLGKIVPCVKRRERMVVIVACVAAVMVVPDHVRPALEAVAFEAHLKRNFSDLPRVVDERTTLTGVTYSGRTITYDYDVNAPFEATGAETSRLKAMASVHPSCRGLLQDSRPFVERIRHVYRHGDQRMEFELLLSDCDKEAFLLRDEATET